MFCDSLLLYNFQPMGSDYYLIFMLYSQKVQKQNGFQVRVFNVILLKHKNKSCYSATHWSNSDTQTLQLLQCFDLGGRKILQVEQYLYPKGPPIAVPSLGIGAFTGLLTGGNIPGSVVAQIHRVSTTPRLKTIVTKIVTECVTHCNGDSPSCPSLILCNFS